MKKVLVTGADGFIGSHLVEFLLNKGYDVRAFVLYNSWGKCGWLDTLPAHILNDLDIFSGDVRDPNGVRMALRGCGSVLHLAALIGIPYSYNSPDSYVDTNITGTLNILQAARDLEIDRVVHTSTSEVYGTAQQVPITEDHPLQAQSPYAATKIAADQLALSFYRSFGLPISILRPFNTYGPRQSARAVIPSIINQISSGMRTLHLGALHPTRDLSFVTDTTAAFEAVLRCPEAVGRVLNGGSGFEISILNVANLIAARMGAEIKITCDTDRLRPKKSEIERLCADNNQLRTITNWEPEFCGLEGFSRGIDRTIDWFTREGNIVQRKNRYII